MQKYDIVLSDYVYQCISESPVYVHGMNYTVTRPGANAEIVTLVTTHIIGM